MTSLKTMWTPRWAIGFVSAVVVGVVAGFVLFTHPLKSVVDPSWANAYPTVEEMTIHADAVVVGRFTKVLGSETSASAEDLIYTNYTFHVDRSIKGPTQGADLLIHQMGGSSGLREMTVPDDPQFQIGDTALLFLHEYAPGKYFVLGGPSGRFPVHGTTVSAMPGSAVALASRPVDQLVTEIERTTNPTN